MSLVNYVLDIEPTPTTLEFQIALTATALTLSVVTPLNIDITASPTGETDALSEALTLGISSDLFDQGGTILGAELTDQVNNDLPKDYGTYTISFGAPLGYTIQVQGVDIKATVDTVSLASYQGMLMASGTVTVS